MTLTFDLLTSNLVRVIASGVGNFPTNFGVSRHFVLDLPYGPRDLATLTFTLEVTALVGDTDLRAPSVYQV